MWILQYVNEHLIIDPFVVTFSYLIIMSSCFLLYTFSIDKAFFIQLKLKKSRGDEMIMNKRIQRWRTEEQRKRERLGEKEIECGAVCRAHIW